MVLGVDIHFEMVPTPALVPVPIPNPFIGMVFDPAGLLIGLGLGAAASLAFGGPLTGPVMINGMPATNVGTNAKGMGHFLFPPGTMWAPMPKFPKPSFKEPPTFPGPPVKPEDDAISIQGSQTVNIMGASGVRTGEMFMSCGEPLRLPSSNVLAIPKGPPVMVGGPPAVSLMAALTAMIKTKWVAGYFHSLLSRMEPSRLRSVLTWVVCTLTGHPIDVATGRVMTTQVDWSLPGPLPLKFERYYSSGCANRPGPLGHGWSHSLDQALWSERGKIVFLNEEGREIEFDTFDYHDHKLPVGVELFEPINRLTLKLNSDGTASVTTYNGIRKDFAKIPGSAGNRQQWLRLKRIRNRPGHTIEIDYDDRGNIEWVTDCGGRQVCFEHDQQGRLTLVKLPHPTERGWLAHTRYSYDGHGDLVQVTDALAHSWHFKYSNHLLVQETNRNGLSFYFAYDGHSQDAYCVRTWGDGGLYDHVIDYDKKGKNTFVTNSLGETTVYHMNAVGLVTEVADAAGAKTFYEYDEGSLRKTKETDPLGRETRWFYDARGNCTKVVQPDGAEVTFIYDVSNSLLEAVDPLAGKWRWEYDGTGQTVKRLDPLGRQSLFVWTAQTEAKPPGQIAPGKRSVRRLTEVVDAAGNRTTLGYDAQGNIDSVRLPTGKESLWRFDLRGRCLEAVDPLGNRERREFDLLSRPVALHQPDGNTRALSYDPEGNVVSFRDKWHDVAMTYAGMRRLTSRTQDGVTVHFRYDTEERMVAVENASGSVYRYVLDPNGKVIEERSYDGTIRCYERDPAGRVTRVVRADNRTSTYTYDIGGRVVGVSHSDGTKETYAYRADGQLMEASNDDVSLKLERNIVGRVVREAQGEDSVESFYNLLDRRSSLRTSKGHELEIDLDSGGELLGMHTGATPAQGPLSPGVPSPWEVHVTRNLIGLEMERLLPGNVSSRWERDQLGRPIKHEVMAGAVPVSAKSFAWEADERLRMVIDALNGPVQYDYTQNGTLAKAAYADGHVDLRLPDALGNLFKTTDRKDRKYGPAGQVLESSDERGITRYDYDPEGNLVHKVEPDGKEWKYVWNIAGLLVQVIRPDGQAVRFGYDALRRRVWKQFGQRTTRWLWDGNVPIHEWVEVSEALPDQTTTPKQLGTAPVVTWVFEPESFVPAAKLSGDQRHSIVTDDTGTPRAVFDHKGKTVWSGDWDVWGNVTNIVGDASACPFRWRGQYEDAETGLYYNRFRYYDPQAGLYVSSDPLGLRGMNPTLYAYVADPHLRADPFGLKGCELKPPDAADHDFILEIDRKVYPETSQHIEDAIANGHPGIVTTGGDSAKNRAASLKGTPTIPGLDRDEWPMAMFREGGAGADIRGINPSDNRGAGSSIGAALRGLPPGSIIKFLFI
jgi:RHS repeat-associated protein